MQVDLLATSFNCQLESHLHIPSQVSNRWLISSPHRKVSWMDSPSSRYALSRFTSQGKSEIMTDQLVMPLACLPKSYMSEKWGLWNSFREESASSNPENTQTPNLQNKLLEKERSFKDAEHELIEKLKERKAQVIEDIKETKTQVKERVSEVVERENIWTIPNMLCVGRLVISPVIFQMILAGEYNTSLGLFLLAGFTDLIDGWIARQWVSQSSRLGSFLDPLADKVLVAFVFLALTINGLIPVSVSAVVNFWDLRYLRANISAGQRTIIRYFDATHATAQLAPTTISKVNTAIQLGLITASLAAPVFDFVDHTALHILWILDVASTRTYIFNQESCKSYKLQPKSPQR
ncbi:unnamed protein product, partial [Meganyctiphanes norvegica]